MLQEIFKDDVLEHSSSSQSKEQAKEQVLSAFRKASSRILVTSDALTRGLDIPGVDLVINYDTPTYPKTYVHRAGRTARAGNEGEFSYCLLIAPELSLFMPLVILLNKRAASHC